jgi:hypothetical protein
MPSELMAAGEFIRGETRVAHINEKHLETFHEENPVRSSSGSRPAGLWQHRQPGRQLHAE